MVEINKKEKFEDGIVSPLTNNCYVVFSRDKVPDYLLESIIHTIKGSIRGYSTKVDPVDEIVKEVRSAVDASKNMPPNTRTVAIIIYQNLDEKDYIIKQVEKISKTKNLLRN